MSEVVYNVGKARALAGAITAGGTNLKAAIIITSKTGAADPDLATMAAIDAVGTVAFHSQRVALTSVTVTTDNTNDRVNIDSGDITFSAAAGVTALALVIYDATTDTSDTTRIPISYHDTGFPQPMDGGLVVAVSDFLRAA
jgi:hypothetical protein